MFCCFQVNILQWFISLNGIYDSAGSVFRRKTEKTDFIFTLIIKERCNLQSPSEKCPENFASARSPRTPRRNGEGNRNE